MKGAYPFVGGIISNIATSSVAWFVMIMFGLAAGLFFRRLPQRLPTEPVIKESELRRQAVSPVLPKERIVDGRSPGARLLIRTATAQGWRGAAVRRYKRPQSTIRF
jgi:hypothetical protein